MQARPIWSSFGIRKSIVPIILSINYGPKKLCGIPTIAVCVVFGEVLVKRSSILPPASVILVNHLPIMDASEKPVPVPEKKNDGLPKGYEIERPGESTYEYSWRSTLPRIYMSWLIPSSSHVLHASGLSSRLGYTLGIASARNHFENLCLSVKVLTRHSRAELEWVPGHRSLR